MNKIGDIKFNQFVPRFLEGYSPVHFYHRIFIANRHLISRDYFGGRLANISVEVSSLVCQLQELRFTLGDDTPWTRRDECVSLSQSR